MVICTCSSHASISLKYNNFSHKSFVVIMRRRNHCTIFTVTQILFLQGLSAGHRKLEWPSVSRHDLKTDTLVEPAFLKPGSAIFFPKNIPWLYVRIITMANLLLLF